MIASWANPCFGGSPISVSNAIPIKRNTGCQTVPVTLPWAKSSHLSPSRSSRQGMLRLPREVHPVPSTPSLSVPSRIESCLSLPFRSHLWSSLLQPMLLLRAASKTRWFHRIKHSSVRVLLVDLTETPDEQCFVTLGEPSAAPRPALSIVPNRPAATATAAAAATSTVTNPNARFKPVR